MGKTQAWYYLFLSFLAVTTKDKKKTDKLPPQAATVVADTSHFKCKEVTITDLRNGMQNSAVTVIAA